MASENETFDEVLRCMQNDVVHFIGKPVKHSRDLLQEYHDRFKAAHIREVAELRECLREAIDMTCENNGTCSDCPIFGEQHGDCNIYKWRKALEGANHGSQTDS